MLVPFIRQFRAVSLLLIAITLAACGSSSDSESDDYPNAYLQFYNASPNGATVTMREVDGDAFGSAQFGDTTSLYARENGEVELEFVRMDAEDQEVLIDTYTKRYSQRLCKDGN